MTRPKPESSTKLAEFVRVAILGWCAALLTASYCGYLPKMDPTYIASLLSGVLAQYGISRIDNNQKGTPVKSPRVKSRQIKRTISPPDSQ